MKHTIYQSQYISSSFIRPSNIIIAWIISSSYRLQCFQLWDYSILVPLLLMLLLQPQRFSLSFLYTYYTYICIEKIACNLIII